MLKTNMKPTTTSNYNYGITSKGLASNKKSIALIFFVSEYFIIFVFVA